MEALSRTLAYYRRQRARGHSHHRALRPLGAEWLKIIFAMQARQRAVKSPDEFS